MTGDKGAERHLNAADPGSFYFCCKLHQPKASTPLLERSLPGRDLFVPGDCPTAPPVHLRPILMVPNVDVARLCGFQRMFFQMIPGLGVEWTIVFEGEDRPDKCTRFCYDLAHRCAFGRWEDINTFVMSTAERGGVEEPVALRFNGTHSGSAKWYDALPFHVHVNVPATEFLPEASTGRLIIWVNTWNHALGQCNNNPEMETRNDGCGYMAVRDYPLFRGSRLEVDRLFGGCLGSFDNNERDAHKRPFRRSSFLSGRVAPVQPFADMVMASPRTPRGGRQGASSRVHPEPMAR